MGMRWSRSPSSRMIVPQLAAATSAPNLATALPRNQARVSEGGVSTAAAASSSVINVSNNPPARKRCASPLARKSDHRSEERRVGKECRCRGAREHEQQKNDRREQHV